MKLKYHVPLLGFLIPTLVISTLMFVYMECPPIIQLIGFYACVIGASISYYAGIHMVLNDRTQLNSVWLGIDNSLGKLGVDIIFKFSWIRDFCDRWVLCKGLKTNDLLM